VTGGHAHTVVAVDAGFAGLETALTARRVPVEVTLNTDNEKGEAQ
jgi:hypothetical protein